MRVQRHNHGIAAQRIAALCRKHGTKCMRPHVEATCGEQDRRDIPGVSHVASAARHGEMCRLGLRQRFEHGPDSAEVVVGNSYADAEGSNQHEGILQHANPRHRANAAGKNEPGDDDERDQHRQRAADCLEARHLHNYAQPGQLQL